MNYHDFIEKAVLTKYLSTVKLPWFGEMIELKCHNKKDTGWTCRCDCARFSLYQETMPETSTKYWVIETCGTKHRVKHLVYGKDDLIFGIHAYEKKTEQILDCERKRADRMIKLLHQSGALK